MNTKCNELYSDLEQIRNDLEWILTNDSIVQFERSNIIEFNRGCSIDKLTVTDGFTKSQRIGLYYQWLFRILITNNSLKLLGEDIQIFENNRTVGSIDYLVKMPNMKIEHWEIAVKFYLLFENQWLGPNANDSLDKKLDKMLSKQLALSDSSAFKKTFPLMPIASKKISLQGRLYINPYLDQKIPSTPTVTPNAIQGFWCWQHQLLSSETFFILEKDQWLSLPKFDESIASSIDNEITSPLHVVDKSNQVWFIVPNSWPR